MRTRRHSALRQLLAGLMCVAWISGTLGAHLHEVLVSHVVCVEHGVVEHASTGDTSAGVDKSAGPSIGAAGEAEHGDACPLTCAPGFTPLLSSPTVAWARPPDFAAPTPLVDAPAARGPPLAYAPKTSPPAAS